MYQQHTAAERVTRARVHLVMNQPFFGALALRLELRADPTCRTGWTDGRTLAFNPAWIDTLSDEELRGFVVHEVLHVSNGHCWRRGARNASKWNEAADLAINQIAQDAGFTLPAGALLDPEYRDLAAEAIYTRRNRPSDDPQSPDQDDDSGDDGDDGDQDGDSGDDGDDGDQDGDSGADGDDGDQDGDSGADGDDGDQDGDSDPGACGEVRDAPADEEPAELEREWQTAIAQAAQTGRAAGNLPGALDRMVGDLLNPAADWRELLHRFAADVARNDYAWTRPNRRHVHRGVYLPGAHSIEIGAIVVAIDTSASIDHDTIAAFGAELAGVVAEVQPARIDVLYCDTHIGRIDTFTRDELLGFEFRPVGGGGTRFAPVFEWIDDQDEPPACLLYLTDCYPDGWPEEPTDYPVLWGRYNSSAEPPFGEVIDIDAE